jgi:hypothetical protein
LAKLSNRVQHALDEGRILVLGTQILIGFQFRSFFEQGFARLPDWARGVKLTAVSLLVLAFAVLVSPTAFHRLVERGNDTPRLHRVATLASGAALLPLAAGFGLELLVGGRAAGLGLPASVVMGAATACGALLLWYAMPALARRHHVQESDMPGTSIETKIDHVLTEARTVLPGVQAILAFQLAVIFTDSFTALPSPARMFHVADILLAMLAVLLLMAPAAYHRIAEQGEETERFHAIASRFVVASMIPLALSLSGGLGIVGYVALRRPGPAVLLGAAFCALFGLAWFGFSWRARRARQREHRRPAPAAARA